MKEKKPEKRLSTYQKLMTIFSEKEPERDTKAIAETVIRNHAPHSPVYVKPLSDVTEPKGKEKELKYGEIDGLAQYNRLAETPGLPPERMSPPLSASPILAASSNSIYTTHDKPSAKETKSNYSLMPPVSSKLPSMSQVPPFRHTQGENLKNDQFKP